MHVFACHDQTHILEGLVAESEERFLSTDCTGLDGITADMFPLSVQFVVRKVKNKGSTARFLIVTCFLGITFSPVGVADFGVIDPTPLKIKVCNWSMLKRIYLAFSLNNNFTETNRNIFFVGGNIGFEVEH